MIYYITDRIKNICIEYSINFIDYIDFIDYVNYIFNLITC